jgi:hypothetical protein
MINNLRLEIENDFGWLWSESQDLDYALDGNMALPNQGPNASYAKNNGPAFAAFQGAEPGALNFAPLTNDPNEFGNNTLGTFTFSATAYTPASPITVNSEITNLDGVALTGTDAAGYFAVNFSDGRIGYVPYTTGAGGVVATLGGVPVSTGVTSGLATGAPLGLIAGQTWTTQAVGWTNVLDSSIDAEEVTIPLTFTVSVAATGGAAGTSALTSLGGVSLATNQVAVQGAAYGQISGRNPNFNKGFLDRVNILQNGSVYNFIAPGNTSTVSNVLYANGGHQFFYEAILPCKLMHDLMMQLNFPIINVGFNFTLFMNQGNGVNPQITFPVLQTSFNTGLITGGTDNTPNPSIFYGAQSGGGKGTRLYYRSVKFSPADNARSVTHHELLHALALHQHRCALHNKPHVLADERAFAILEFVAATQHALLRHLHVAIALLW